MVIMQSEVIKRSVKNIWGGEMMRLKTITLADLEKTDIEEQMKKIQEEMGELKKAYKFLESAKLFDNNEIRINKREKDLISELYDLIQSAAGALWIIEGGVSMNDEHIEKIEWYEATGRINNKAREKQK